MKNRYLDLIVHHKIMNPILIITFNNLIKIAFRNEKLNFFKNLRRHLKILIIHID